MRDGVRPAAIAATLVGILVLSGMYFGWRAKYGPAIQPAPTEAR